MAATELLDYNQIQEQSPATGETVPPAGGPMIWQFRADPNLAWDPSQSFFAMDIKLETYAHIHADLISGAMSTSTGAGSQNSLQISDKLLLDALDLRPFFPLRCFNSMSHTIDGVTVASTQRPYMDKLIQERYLHESTQSNLSNFESLQLTRCIDSGDPADNIFLASGKDISAAGFSSYEMMNLQHAIAQVRAQSRTGRVSAAKEKDQYVTVLFQPPFDFWTKHQRCSGGNHQITMNLQGQKGYVVGVGGQTATLTAAEAKWGSYISSDCIGNASLAVLGGTGDYMPIGTGNAFSGVAKETAGSAAANIGIGEIGDYLGSAVDTVTPRQSCMISANIKRIRLLRRMVRFTIERPIATQEFNLTEFQLYIGQPTNTGVSQNFLLPSSTFGLVFFLKDSANTEHDVLGDFPVFEKNADQAGVKDCSPTCNINEFYFTYGGETYPAQRIKNITTQHDDEPMGYQKLQTIANQLMGTYNMPQEYINQSFTKGGLMSRLDGSQFFFPVAKHANSDNSDLQVTYSITGLGSKNGPVGAARASTPSNVSLCVVALYDARIELSYNAANQLEKVTKTEWK